MGCDIHLIVEKQNENGSWTNLIEEVWTPRNYILFGNLVKGHYRFPEGRGKVEARGLPEDFYRSGSWEYFHFSIHNDLERDVDFLERSVSRERANKWRSEIVYKGDFPHEYVRDPDHHSHSWLTTQEFESALISSRIDYNEVRAEDDLKMMEVFADNFTRNQGDALKLLRNYHKIIGPSFEDPVEEYEAILNYMRSFKDPCRIVFAFDN